MAFLNKFKFWQAKKGVLYSFFLYWNYYGGFSALFRSAYLYLALIISLIAAPFWLCPGKEDLWFEISLSVLPNLLGFTLGGYAILLAFGNTQFFKLISSDADNGEPSPFIQINATFVHFIFLQLLALILALIGSAWGLRTGFFAWIGFTCFIYAILTGIAATFAIFNVARWFELFLKNSNNRRP